MKATLIKKNVILVRLSNSKLNIERLSECFLFRGTYSVRKDKWTFYCKSEGYYSTFNYSLIIDTAHENDAINEMFKIRDEKFKEDIAMYESQISKIKEKISADKKIKDEINI